MWNFPFGCQVIASGLALRLQLTPAPKGYRLSCDTRKYVNLQLHGTNPLVSIFFIAIYEDVRLGDFTKAL